MEHGLDETLRREIVEVLGTTGLSIHKLAKLLGVGSPTLVRLVNGAYLEGNRLQSIRERLQQLKASYEVPFESEAGVP